VPGSQQSNAGANDSVSNIIFGVHEILLLEFLELAETTS
jgi:hypothetical protein